METYSIYCITNVITGRKYIGRTTNPTSRFTYHLYKLRNGNHNIPDLQHDFKTYGEHCFTFTVLHVIEDWLEASEMERQTIRNAGNSYNRLGNPFYIHHHTLRAMNRTKEIA
jgi:group I intron endonuclease